MIPQTGIGRFLFFFLIALTAAQWLLPLAVMSSLPERVPIHFDLQGNPDRYTSRTSWELWFGAIIGTFLGVLVIALMKFPGAYNVPWKAEIAALPEPQRHRLHDLMREMLLGIFVAVQGMMLAMVALIFSLADERNVKMPWFIIIAFLVVPLAIMAAYLVRISRALDRAKCEAGMA